MIFYRQSEMWGSWPIRFLIGETFLRDIVIYCQKLLLDLISIYVNVRVQRIDQIKASTSILFIIRSKMQPTKSEKVTSYIDEIFPPENFQNYTIKKIIGKGSYGHVAKAIRKNGSGFVAIKKITNLFATLPETRRILRELILLKNCQHPNIVQMIDVIIPKDQNLENFTQVYLVTEFCDSDLQKVFKTDGNFFELQHIRHISYQIFCGIKYLHSANIIHRDLKPANVLINSKGLTVKICDFGLSRTVEQSTKEKQSESEQEQEKEEEKVIQSQEESPSKGRKKGLKRMGTGVVDVEAKKKEQKQEMRIIKKQKMSNPQVKLTLRVTTRWYRAPELILLDKDYNKPIDIWSAGCIFGELLKMQKIVCADSLQRFPLFPGKYCYPVSPNTLGNVYKNGYPQGRNDQLFMILSAIGKPSEEQMSFLTDDKAKDYIRKLEAVQRKTFEQMFPKVDGQAIALLKQTLRFAPSFRISIDQILNHPFYEKIRRPQLEKGRDPITINPQIQDQGLTLGQLRMCFVKQLAPYIIH